MKNKICAVCCPTIEIAYVVAELFKKHGYIIRDSEIEMFWENYEEETVFCYNEVSNIVQYCGRGWFSQNPKYVLYEYTNDIEDVLLRDGWFKQGNKE